MMFNILSFDYELFGSGKGCVFKHLIEPTKSILNVLRNSDIKATFFVEVLEIEAIVGLKKKFPQNSYEHKAATALEIQLEEIVIAGHDIQLHLHPQWLNAEYIDGEWSLDFRFWRFSSLPTMKEQKIPSKSELILDAINKLEARVRKIKPSYKCHSFRAGGYNLGTDINSIEALVNNGIRIDSSVCHGFYENSTLSRFDYTTTDTKRSKWFCNDNILDGDDKLHNQRQCLEIPLITLQSNFFERLSLARLLNTLVNRNYKAINYREELLPNKPLKPNALKNSNFDVCLSSDFQVRKFEKMINLQGYEYAVLIGHPKDYSIFSPLPKILEFLKRKRQFITFDDVYEREFL